MKVKLLIISLLFFIAFIVSAENKYYKIILKAEQKIIDEQLDSSLYFYNKAFTEYNYPFVKDLYAAACVSLYDNDTITLYKYVEILLKRGMPISEFEYFLEKRPNDKKLIEIKTRIDQYYKSYYNSISQKRERLFAYLDMKNQIYIYLRKHQPENLSLYINYSEDTLAKEFIYLTKSFGFPKQLDTGIGSYSGLYFTDEGRSKIDESVWKYIDKPDIRIRRKDSVFYCWKKQARSVFKYSFSSGGSLLWHLKIKDYKQLNDILLRAIDSLQLNPAFYAACLERDGEDYGISWASKVNFENKFDLKRIIKLPYVDHINKNREILGLRSLEMELRLFQAVNNLDKIIYKDFYSKKQKQRNLFYKAFHSSLIP